MRIFLGGATGVIGVRLLPLLVAVGHEVAGLTRSVAKTEVVRSLGGHPVVCDVFDAPALQDAVVAFAPDLVMHQLTNLPEDQARIPEFASGNARIRREGTRNLLDAAAEAGATRFLAQSVAWQLPGDGGVAVAEHEQAVLGAGGVVLRYGQFYGPGTYFPTTEPPPPKVHVNTAARRTVDVLDAPSGVIVIVDGAD